MMQSHEAYVARCLSLACRIRYWTDLGLVHSLPSMFGPFSFGLYSDSLWPTLSENIPPRPPSAFTTTANDDTRAPEMSG